LWKRLAVLVVVKVRAAPAAEVSAMRIASEAKRNETWVKVVRAKMKEQLLGSESAVRVVKRRGVI
jgi:hypothetical protein